MCVVYGGFWIGLQIEYSLIDLSLAGAGVTIPYHTIPYHTCILAVLAMCILAYLLYHTLIAGACTDIPEGAAKSIKTPQHSQERFYFGPSAIPQRTPRPSPMPTTNWLLWLFVPFLTRFTNQMLFVNPLHPSCWTWPFPFVRPHVIRPVLKRPYLSNHTCDSGRRSKKAVSRSCTSSVMTLGAWAAIFFSGPSGGNDSKKRADLIILIILWL